jgi:hypothetical protein
LAIKYLGVLFGEQDVPVGELKDSVKKVLVGI